MIQRKRTQNNSKLGRTHWILGGLILLGLIVETVYGAPPEQSSTRPALEHKDAVFLRGYESALNTLDHTDASGRPFLKSAFQLLSLYEHCSNNFATERGRKEAVDLLNQKLQETKFSRTYQIYRKSRSNALPRETSEVVCQSLLEHHEKAEVF